MAGGVLVVLARVGVPVPLIAALCDTYTPDVESLGPGQMWAHSLRFRVVGYSRLIGYVQKIEENAARKTCFPNWSAPSCYTRGLIVLGFFSVSPHPLAVSRRRRRPLVRLCLVLYNLCIVG